MKKNRKSTSGMTLIEITVVIALILSLITILLVGFNAYKVGADRAKCVLNLSNIQKAVRSFANLNEMSAGDEQKPDQSGVAWTKDEIVGAGLFLDVPPRCPTLFEEYSYNAGRIPDIGEMAAVCVNATYGYAPDPDETVPTNKHAPKSRSGW